MMNMRQTTNRKLVIAFALIALLATPASARIDGDEGGASAYPYRDQNGRGVWVSRDHDSNGVLINRPSRAR